MSTQRFSGERLFDTTNAFKHVVDAQQRRAACHLENPRRLCLNLLSYQRVKPFAGGEIDLDRQTLLEQALSCHQVQCIEPAAGIVIDKKIDIAFRAGLVAGCRTEQIKRRGAQRLDGTRLIAKFPECFGPGRGASVS
jgi:hypothetical protein